MKLKIDQKIFEKFSGLTIGVVICKNLNNSGTSDEIQKEIRVQENNIKEKYNTETLSQHPKIDTWRKAYSLFGGEPKKNRSSIENLYKMILQGVQLRHINPLVDNYNFISLKYMVPVGGEDTDKIQGDVILTFAESNEPSVLLLGEKEPHSPHNGEVIYKDDISAICRRWNWREAERTKLTENTKNCFLVIEGLLPVTKVDIENATKELHTLVQKNCGGNISYIVLDEKYNETEI
ncbi:MAG: phenylalanine--tRNA ligase beta subunit-related protein [Candidatus Woesearchaeota archaeon]|jgi:DNA/RNA-binding domain of Phe-tRNA-synthetase-like protein